MEVPPLVPPDPIPEYEPTEVTPPLPSKPPEEVGLPATEVAIPTPPPVVEEPAPLPVPAIEEPAPPPAIEEPAPVMTAPPPPITAARTQLQQVTAKLIHVQTDRQIELPFNLSVIHIGKPNDRIPPDIDVSGFPNSEVVSRVHADIRVEGEGYYIEDIGSSNGTYINNLPLLPGNRHRLRPGDRISLGKGDMVTFLFQQS
jgi:pSer/pThr/pTyr-binding forkhead associated (FHA) protein